MIVIRARSIGFCSGVRRAVQLAEQTVERSGSHPVYSLGSLVHNQTVTDKLKARGIQVLPDNELPPPGSVVVIRSHGVPPETLSRLSDAGASIVDATCPKVTANQRTAARHAASGRKVIIAGDEGHGEVTGLAGHAPGAIVVPDPRRALEYPQDGPLTLIAQTTMSQPEVDAIAAALAENNKDLVMAGGICGATADRQTALQELLPQVDAVVIVGGKDSANTRRLTALAREAGKPAWQIASAVELKNGKLAKELGRFERIGLSAGASTPDEDIGAVERCLIEL